MKLKKIAVVFNGFVHDFASGIWLAAIAAISMLHDAHLREPAVTPIINLLEHRFFWCSVVAMVLIMATGAGRTFTYVDNWSGADGENVRRRMLIIKHVVLLSAFALGYWYVYGKVFHW